MAELAAALDVAIAAARAAGYVLRDDFHRPGGPRGSGSHAEADAEAEAVIKQHLLAAFPWSYRGEELGYTGNSGAGKGHANMLWLVDPNDGTSAYLKGHRGSSVSIAALRDGVPVLGVVYAFGYPDDDGDLIAWAEGCPLTRNAHELKTSLAAGRLANLDEGPAVVFISQDADYRPQDNTLCVQPARYISLPSIAYRLARVAAGDGVAAVSLAGACSWDYAAGDALIRAAGGLLIDERGATVAYTPDGQSNTQWCFGGRPDAVRELRKRDWGSVLLRGKIAPWEGLFQLVRPQRGKTIADAALLSRAQGCLLGQLAGDALGGLTEFEPVESIKKQYPTGVRELRDGGTWHNLAGQPTDDSEMALMLARSIVQSGTYEPANSLDAYVHWWPKAWDRGSTISQAVGAASRGKSSADRLLLAEEHASETSQSNGALMRISPLAIYASADPFQAAELARQECRLTHPHQVCVDACAVYVVAVAPAVSTGCTAKETYAAAVQEAERSESQASVRTALESAKFKRPGDYHTHMGWVLIALQNAFYQLLHAPDLESGVVDTVMQGGDTDTNAAIAGALLGAVHGRRGVPDRWIRALLSCRPLPGTPTRHPQPPEFWPVDALQLAEALLIAGRTV